MTVAKESVKVKYIDEQDKLQILFFDSMDAAYKHLEKVRKAYGGESFPLSITVNAPYMKGKIES